MSADQQGWEAIGLGRLAARTGQLGNWRPGSKIARRPDLRLMLLMDVK